jgi:hypothetical protein
MTLNVWKTSLNDTASCLQIVQLETLRMFKF